MHNTEVSTMQSVVSAIKSEVSAIQSDVAANQVAVRVGRWQLTGQVVAAAEQSGR